MVAKSFQKYEIVGEPYERSNRSYVKVKMNTGSLREVRWYTEAEYKRMYPNDTSISNHSNDPFYKSQKDTLGFENGYITIFKGDTYDYKDWFKEHGARYTKFWGWSFGSFAPVPDVLPANLTPIRLDWELVGDGDTLKSEDAIKEAIEELLYEESPSEYVGQIGEKIEKNLVVKSAIPLNGFYGQSIMHIMTDVDQNVYVWTTTAKALTVGATYIVKGTVKEHKKYQHTKQTVLTRCRCQEVEDE